MGNVVAIGASAGGLDALERLFGGLPADTGAAFVVVQHLSPDHKSMMDNLLARYTAMPVKVAEHGAPLAPDTVFLIPPGKTMHLAGDRLQLAPKPLHGLSLPIDIFFGSLAEQHADRAHAVVLSGTGSDGSRGLSAINANGGFVFVQDPATAKFDGMPRSAIGTGFVDVVGSAEQLALRIAAHLCAPRGEPLRLAGGGGGGPASLVQPLDGILELLLTSSGIDFREYKPNTVLRRIERRMQVLHAGSLAEYHERLSASPDEQALLRRELLIPVTRFFRDAEVFEDLAERVLPALATRDGAEPLRAWVACCATGEEAYTLAMLFAEAFERAGRSRPVKIFATDVEPQYLDQASAGHYPATIAAEVGPDRLQRWFTERQGGWTVRSEIRQMVIFARHNLIADPPFTRMDLVSCRNALIYLQPVAQERALRRLQYALGEGGHLLLGPSESLGVLHRDFQPLAGGHKLYRLLRRDRLAVMLDGGGRHRSLSAGGAPVRTTPYRSPGAAAGASGGAPGPGSFAGPGGGSDAQALVDGGQRALLQGYAPPSLLVGESRELLHVYGDVREVLRIGEGQATLDVLKLLPREIAWAAGALLQSLATDRRTLHSGPLRLPSPEGTPGGGRRLRIVARPVDPGGERALVLLSFEPLPGADPGPAGDGPGGTAAADAADAVARAHDDDHRRQVEMLERELSLTHDTLQATIEELETSNEELQATNEELMASNEELQSTNEELQSVNEELYTVNAEYQEKVDILNSVNADLENVSKAAAIPTVFVDEHLALTRFTPEATQLFKLREGDVGRSLEDFAHVLEYPELFADLRRTLATGMVTEREVSSRGGQWWLARIQPYRARLPGASRAVMTFVEVTSLKDSQRLQAVLDSLAEHLAVVDAHGTISLVNAAWRRFAADHGDPELRSSGPGSNYLSVCAQAALADPDARAAHDGLAAVLAGRQAHFTLQYPCDTRQRRLWFLMHVAAVDHPAGGAVVSHVDITPWVEPPLPAQADPPPRRPLQEPSP